MELFNDPKVDRMVRTVGTFGQRFKYRHAPCWLSILGACGVGKTHCATKFWKHMASKMDWREFEFIQSPIYWPEFIQSLRQGVGYEKLVELGEWPVLFLDDIGAERDTTGFASEQLNALLGRRVGKWTIITSNLSIEQLAKIDPRIGDRIIRERGNCFVEIDTISFGLRKNSEAQR